MRRVTIPLLSVAFMTLGTVSAQAMPWVGQWLPAPSTMAEYCRDESCALLPLDASISFFAFPEVLGTSIVGEWEFGFAPAGFDFSASVGSTFSQEDFSDGGTLQIEVLHGIPISIVFRFASETSLVGSGFARLVVEGFPAVDVRFHEAEFVPVPEPRTALLLALGLVGLAGGRGRPGRLSSRR